ISGALALPPAPAGSRPACWSCDRARGARPEPGSGSRSGPHLPRGEILLLFGGQCVDRDAHGRQLEPGDLRIELTGDAVHVLAELLAVVHDVLGRERLVREGDVRYACAVA